MNVRARLALTSTVLLVGATTSACGGGAPADASEKDFCDTQSSLFDDLLPEDMANPELPSNEEMARAVKDWGQELEEIGTPDGISDDARAGFEQLVEQAGEIDAADFTIDQLEELEQGGADASKAAQRQAEAFADYLTETCGNPLDGIEMPEMPEMPGATE
ncbi:hypothetical protein GCM10009641_34860 [Mycobacterium cookii]|uniref:Small secreted protein n=1 Tax=Nocardioides furvisabuli TaxID=375542 RepID=A0ABP5IND2_9ACTN|nr:hypothetical protein [Nocardioides furvisabuli]